jgi:hypothetical protein
LEFARREEPSALAAVCHSRSPNVFGSSVSASSRVRAQPGPSACGDRLVDGAQRFAEFV